MACEVSSGVKVVSTLSSWPRDTFLQLKVLLRASVLQSLSLGYWPAKQVAMVPELFPQDAKLVHQLVEVLKLDLGVVLLHLRNIMPASLKHLACGPWLALRCLDLSSIYLKAVEIEHLVSARILLRELDLSNTSLTLEGVKQLILSHWPLLETLAVSGNHIEPTKLWQLIKGRWPFLRSVDLHNNKVQSGDLRILRTAQWPSLACMCLTENSFNTTVITGGYATGEEYKRWCKEAEKQFKVRLQVKWSNIKVVL